MTSRKPMNIVQRIKGLITEPSPRDLINLMNSFREHFEAVTLQSGPPNQLINALRSAGTHQVIALSVQDLPIKAVLYPLGRPSPDREAAVWENLCTRVQEWHRMEVRADRLHREPLEPELGAVSLTSPAAPSGETAVLVVNTDQPPPAARQALRMLKVLVPASLLAGAEWTSRRIRHPVVVTTVASSAAIGAALAGVAILQHSQPPARPPAAVGPSYTSTSSPAPSNRIASPLPATPKASPSAQPDTPRPSATSYSPVPATSTRSERAMPPAPPAAPSSTPRRSSRPNASHTSPPSATSPPNPTSPTSPPPQPTPPPVTETQPPDEPIAEPEQQATDCNGVLHADIDPLLDVCVGL